MSTELRLPRNVSTVVDLSLERVTGACKSSKREKKTLEAQHTQRSDPRVDRRKDNTDEIPPLPAHNRTP